MPDYAPRPGPNPSPAPSRRDTRQEAALVAVLFCAMLFSTLPEFSLGVLAPVLIADLAVGEASIGLAASTMYLGAAVVARTGGRLLDEMHHRLALVVMYGTAAGSLLLLASSRSMVGLMAVGIVGSVGLGMNNPITSRLIVDGVRSGRHGLAIGLKQTGVKVGQSLAGAALPALALGIGWRRSLGALAGLVLGVMALSMLAVPSGSSAVPQATHRTSVRMARRQVRWLQQYSFAMAVSQSALTIYLALYAVQRLDATPTQGGLLITVFAVTATVTRLIWVTAANRLVEPRHALLVLSAGAGVSMTTLLVAPAVAGMTVVWLAATLAGMTIGAWNVVVQLAILTEVAPERAASATGGVQAAFMLGLAAGAPAFGFVVQFADSFLIAWGLTIAVCGGAWAVVWRHEHQPAGLS